MYFRAAFFAGLLLSFLPFAPAQERIPRTFFVTRSLGHEQFIPFLEKARPEIVQIGNYGAMFHGHADNEKSTKSPMMLPVVGERAALDFQKELNAKVHDLGLKVVGHFRLIKAMGNWEEKTGFVDYYNHRWPVDLLGPKPHRDLIELLQRDASGTPIQVSRYGQGQIAFCLSSPHARQMFRQMLKVAIDHGVNGIVSNYNYHFECACPHCQESFRSWLQSRISPEEIQQKLEISDLRNHRFDSIPAKITGYPETGQEDQLPWLAMRWAAENFKRNFDEIFVDYGRSLKPDLLVAQWNHLGHVGMGNERMFLDSEMWGSGESYFWESGGAAFVGKNLSLSERKAGDAWLSCLTVRELGGGKPFVMGKYDRIRMAASMAEGYATGGLGMGRYMRFEEPEGFETLARYCNFMHRHRHLYDRASPYSEALLVLPRNAAWLGKAEPWERFREIGQSLLERNVLVDVVEDRKLTWDRLHGCRALILPGAKNTYPFLNELVDRFSSDGGMVFTGDTPEKPASRIWDGGGTRITAPWTVRSTAYLQDDRLLLHLVNYNRDEGETREERGAKPKNERPIAVENISVDLALPQGRRALSVKLHTPDGGEALNIEARLPPHRAVFTIPKIGVYGVVEITLSPM